MKRQSSYVWAIGYTEGGQPTICGPFLDDSGAADGTAHLNGVHFVKLGTANRATAIPQLRKIARSHHFQERRLQADEPTPPEPEKKGILRKIFRRKTTVKEEEFGD